MLDFALFILGSKEYVSLHTASSDLNSTIDQEQLRAVQAGAPFTVLDPAVYTDFFNGSDADFDSSSIFLDTPVSKKILNAENERQWLGYMSASRQLFLAVAPKDLHSLDGVLGEALAGLLDRQENFIINHMHSNTIGKQKMESTSELLLAEAGKKHSEWMSLIVLQPKPLAKYLLDKYGDHAADGVAIVIQRLAASLIQPVGLAFMLSGGRLLLSVFAHSKSDPQLIASQLIKNFRKLYAWNPEGSQPALETDMTRSIQILRSELPLPELSNYCVAENKAESLADCLAELN